MKNVGHTQISRQRAASQSLRHILEDCCRCELDDDAMPNKHGKVLKYFAPIRKYVPYSRKQKHVSISDTPMLLIEINSISNMGCQK